MYNADVCVIGLLSVGRDILYACISRTKGDSPRFEDIESCPEFYPAIKKIYPTTHLNNDPQHGENRALRLAAAQKLLGEQTS